MKNPIVKYPLTLGIIGAICAFSLALVHSITTPIIAKRVSEEAKQAVRRIYPTAEEVVDISEHYAERKDYGVTSVYEIKEGGKTSAYGYQTSAIGYSGEIIMLVVLSDEKDEILGYATITQSETVGGTFGDTLLRSPDFDAQFNNLPFDKVATGVDFVAGSTAKVTMKGVKDGVNKTIDFHKSRVKGGR